MMRSPHSFAAVVRRRNGALVVRERQMPDVRRGRRAWPLIRGVVGLVEALKLGSASLRFSAEIFERDLEEAENEAKGEAPQKGSKAGPASERRSEHSGRAFAADHRARDAGPGRDSELTARRVFRRRTWFANCSPCFRSCSRSGCSWLCRRRSPEESAGCSGSGSTCASRCFRCSPARPSSSSSSATCWRSAACPRSIEFFSITARNTNRSTPTNPEKS